MCSPESHDYSISQVYLCHPAYWNLEPPNPAGPVLMLKLDLKKTHTHKNNVK